MACDDVDLEAFITNALTLFLNRPLSLDDLARLNELASEYEDDNDWPEDSAWEALLGGDGSLIDFVLTSDGFVYLRRALAGRGNLVGQSRGEATGDVVPGRLTCWFHFDDGAERYLRPTEQFCSNLTHTFGHMKLVLANGAVYDCEQFVDSYDQLIKGEAPFDE